MIICVCHRVSHKTIEQCARAGAHFDDIRSEHRVGTQCGQCEHTARRIWHSAYQAPDCAPCAAPLHTLPGAALLAPATTAASS